MDSILQLKGLSRRYPDFHLDNIHLCLPTGCIMGLIGKNGAGKTTLIRLILDLIQKESGDICLFGQGSLREKPQNKEYIGVVLDEVTFANNLTAKAVNAVMRRSFKTWNSDSYFSYLERFSLPQNKQIEGFSRGMKTKVSLAVALSHESKLLVLDEATSGLDPAARSDILEICLEFIQDEQKSILLSSHILSDLEKICDYITLLDGGKLLFSEEKDVLLDKYAILHCTKETLLSLREKDVISVRQHQFGNEVLVLRQNISKDIKTENTTIEDVMLFLTREGRAS